MLFLSSALIADEYWADWNINAKLVLACESEDTNSSFMVAALDNLGNAERTEGNAEVLEKLALSKPECFSAAAQSLGKELCFSIYSAFLKNPLFTKASNIANVFQSKQALCNTANKALKRDKVLHTSPLS
jgi:hypothetical protein